MKRLCATLLIVFLCVMFFAGCNANDSVLADMEAFMKSYTSYHVDENYYENHDLDFDILYDVTMEDAEVTNADRGRKEYELPLASSLFGTNVEMTVCTDKKDTINSIEISMEDGAVNLFGSPEDMATYLSTVIVSANHEISDDSAWNIVADLWDDQLDDYWGHVSTPEVDYYLYTGATVLFMIEVHE